MRLTALLFLIAFFQTAALPPQTPGSVDGVVVEAGSGRPLKSATVQLQARSGVGLSGALVTTTRDDGSFVFRSVPPGLYSIQAELGGYIPETYGNATTRSPNGSADLYNLPAQQLAAGQKISGIRLSLTRGAVISGRLVDDRGEPVVGNVVQALKTTYKDGLPERQLIQSAVSNDLGEYRLFMLRPGEYNVSVIPSGIAPSPLYNATSAIPLYFPGTIDAKAAQPIELHEGESVDGVNFSAIPTQPRRVTGSVQRYGGEPAGVVLSPLNGTSSVHGTVDANEGTFQFSDVTPGSYMLVARTSSMRSMIPLDVRNTDVLNMQLSVGNGFRIPVHIHVEGHPPGDDPELEKVYFRVRPETTVPGIEAETYSPFPNGRFALDVVAGDYRLDITRPEDSYVKSITLDGADVLNQGLHVNGSMEGTMEIVIASSSGSLEGRIDGNNGRDVTVVLAPDAARRGQRALFKSVKAVAGGEFRFQKVPPGDYKLFAWAAETAENGGPWLDPEYLRKYEDRGTPVHVDAERKTTLDRAVPFF